jgi:hypothetical protein
MLESTQVARTRVERGLAQLQTLGLCRPSNVLWAEYLQALTAEDVLDVVTADGVSAAYNRVRYSAVPDDDREVSDAVVALDRVAADVAAMSSQARQKLAQRLSNRLTSAPADPFLERDTDLERDTEALLDGQATPVPPTRQKHVFRHDHEPRRDDTAGTSDEHRAFTSGALTSGAGASHFRDKRALLAAFLPATIRGHWKLPRVSLGFAALAALGTFCSGYFFREALNPTADAGNDLSFASSGSDRASVKQLLRFPKLVRDAVRSRGDEEAPIRAYDQARLALQLVLAYAPENAGALNDLAQLYLTPDEAGTTNPERALRLTERALSASRESIVLDTAAEAQFRCGNVREAVRLAQEALAKGSDLGIARGEQFRAYRLKQLKKFQDADQIRTAQRAPDTPNEMAKPGTASAKSRIDAPLASDRNKSAGT